MENVSFEIWVDLKKRELDSVNKSLDEENKNRRRSEFLLLLFCIISFVYIYPVSKIDSTFLIEIPSISLKIPLQAALIGFPTLITSIYLILLNSAIRQSRLRIISIKINNQLKDITRGTMLFDDKELKSTKGKISLLLLPSPIQMPTYSNNRFTKIGNYLIKWFVGIVFNLFPFITSLLIIIKTQDLLGNILILIWNIVCITIMLVSFISTYINYSTSTVYEAYGKAV